MTDKEAEKYLTEQSNVADGQGTQFLALDSTGLWWKAVFLPNKEGLTKLPSYIFKTFKVLKVYAYPSYTVVYLLPLSQVVYLLPLSQ